MVIQAPKGKRPYKRSSKSVEQSKAEITKLLREYGAEGVAWTDNFATGAVNLRFVVKDAAGNATAYSITPAAFKEQHRSWDSVEAREKLVEAPNWPRAMRLLHAWLKTKLESIAYGLTETREEFLAHMVVRDVRGAESTAGELVLHALEMGGGQLALEAPRKREGAVDAESHEVR
jgi:hypothetical protein